MKYFLFLFSFLVVGQLFAQKIATFPYFEDFENGAAGWVASGTSSSWAFGTPSKSTIQGASSGTKAWVTGGTGGGQYNANENSAVLGPEFDFTNMLQPVVQLRVWWNAEFSWDGAVWQATTNNGSSWLTIGSTSSPGNWYTDNTINGNPGGQQSGWTGRASTTNGSNGWVTAKHGMNALIGEPSVKFRVAFGSDGSVHDDGFAFDDILIFDRRAKDVGILKIVSPVQDCGFGGTYDVEINLRNFGFEVADSFSLAYQINNDPPVIEAFTGSVGSDMNFSYTFNQQAVLNQSIDYTISTWLLWPQDEENSNDSILNQGLKNIMPFGPTTFEGYYGNNIANVIPGWNEGKGNNPNIVKSRWTESDTIQTLFYDVATAKINLTGSGVNDWLLTPSFVVPQPSRMFYSIGLTGPGDTLASIMGDDDYVKVRVSIDCGSTWADLKTYVKADNLGPAFREEVLVLDAFVGQEIIIGIQANTVLTHPASYDFHISLQEARFVYPDDLGISDFRLGNGLPIMQAGSGDQVYYTIKNYGSNSVPNIPVLAYVGASLYQHIQYNALPQNQEVEILAGGYWAYSNGPANVPVKIFTMIANDTINHNDTLFSSITVLGVTGIQNGIDEKGVRVFPNPSKGNFQIDFGKDVFFDQLEIFDPSGKSILKRNLEKGVNGLSLNLEDKEITPGVYFLRLWGLSTSDVLELVIE